MKKKTAGEGKNVGIFITKPLLLVSVFYYYHYCSHTFIGFKILYAFY